MKSSLPSRKPNGLRIYRFSIFQSVPELSHGIFGRQGGVSQEAFSSLNLSFSVGDEQERVVHNRSLLMDALEVDSIHSLKQVHGKEVRIIQDGQAAPHPFQPETVSGDILMTDKPGLGLLIKQADCQAIVLYDPEHRAVANVHCGWRGNIGGVIRETISTMRKIYGSRPSRLLAGIGPSLGPCCAEFVNYRTEIPPQYWSYQVRRNYFDLWRMSRDQLRAEGLPEKNIEVAGICTSCETSHFFSYRKEKKTGRFGTMIALKRKA